MAVAIRLTRVGATKRPAYRVIAIDKRRSRDGRALEILGFYDPLTEPATVQLDTAKIQAWIGKGAQPSDMVVRLMRQAEAAASGEPVAKPKRAARAAKPSKKAQAKAAAAAAAPESAPEPPTDAEAQPEAVAEAPAETEAVAGEAPAEETEAPAEVESAEEAPAADAEAAADEAPAAEGDATEEPAADAEKADA